jgi:hypothetical protein
MTYGHWLDRATDALRDAAGTAAHGRADGHREAVAAVAARSHVYTRLVHLVDLLTDPHPPAPTVSEVSTVVADQLVNRTSRITDAGPGHVLAVGLRAAAHPPPAAGAAAGEGGALAGLLQTAADALGFAGDIVASHTGPPGGHPRTPEGHAIAAGAGRHGALADIARLASDTLTVDRRMIGWLARGRPATTLRPVFQPVTDHLRWWTGGNYPTVLHGIASHGHGTSLLRLLDVAPATEPSTAAARPVASLHDVAAVLDSTRAWLRQHPSQAQLSDIIAATRLAITVTAYATKVGSNGPVDPHQQARRWSHIAKALPNLAGLERTQPGRLRQDLEAAADWLRTNLNALSAAGAAADAQPAARRDDCSAMLHRLPGLAAELGRAIDIGLARGHLCVAHTDLDLSAPRRGVYRATTRWRRASPADQEVRALRRRLTAAAAIPANDTGNDIQAAQLNPAALAHLSHPTPSTPTPAPAPTASDLRPTARGARPTL